MKRLPFGSVMLIAVLAVGCSQPDRRFTELAERSVERQKEQNELVARQSQAVIEENQRVAEAAQQLIAKDAESRRELIKAQQDLASQVHEANSQLDRQREELEKERRVIAAQRHRDPILAEAIRSLGMLLIGLLPLLVVMYALSRLTPADGGDQALAEFLVTEIANPNSALLEMSRAQALLPPSASGNTADCDLDSNTDPPH